MPRLLVPLACTVPPRLSIALLLFVLLAPPAWGEDAPSELTPKHTANTEATGAAPTIVVPRIQVQGDAPSDAASDKPLDTPGFQVRLDPATSVVPGLTDLLLTVPGAHTRTLGGPGNFATLSVRGAPAGHTEIHQDGVPLSRLGSAAIDLGTIDAAGFDSIIVTRGPLPRASAPASAGLLELTLGAGRAPGQPASSVSTGVGSWGLRFGRASTRFGSTRDRTAATFFVAGQTAHGDFDAFDDGGTPYDTSDDGTRRRSNADHEQGSAGARVALRTSQSAWELGVRGFVKEQGIPGPLSVNALSTRLATRRLSLDGRRTGHATGPWSFGSLTTAWGMMESTTFEDPQGELGFSGGSSDTRVWGTGVRSEAHALPHARHIATLFVETSAEGWRESTGDVHADGARGMVALGVADDWTLDARERFALSIAVRTDAAWGTGHESLDVFVAPRAGLLVRVAESWAIKTHVARVHRWPTLPERSGDRGFLVGNPALRPERGTLADAGVVWQPTNAAERRPRGELELVGFAGHMNDLIWVVPGTSGAARAENLGATWIAGAEVSARARPWPWLAVLGTSTWLVSEQRSMVLALDGAPLPGRPRYDAFARADGSWNIGRFECGGGIHVAMLGASSVDIGGLEKAPARQTAGAHLSVSAPGRFELAFGVENLFDRRTGIVDLPRSVRPGVDTVRRPISDQLGYPLPGRSFVAALTWTH